MAHTQPLPHLTQDLTRGKLLAAAADTFASVGFEQATVRDIAQRAGVNVASINYHFGDKLGLYTELLRSTLLQPESPVFPFSSDTETPEAALRSFVVGMFERMYGVGRSAWYAKVMAHELVRPTPALKVVVQHFIKPNALNLSRIVGRLIGRPADDRLTRLCVHSVIAQTVHHVHARPVIHLLWPEIEVTPENLEEIANHVVDFSLAAFRKIRRPNKATSHKQGSRHD